MPANFIIPLGKVAYEKLVDEKLPSVTAAKTDPLFVFDAVNYAVEIHGEYREIGKNPFRKGFGDLLSRDLRDPEKAVELFGTRAYQIETKERRDQARRGLRGIAPPNGVAALPPAGVTGQMDAAEAGKHMLTNGGGAVLGYSHGDQDSKDFTTELIKKSGGTDLKHLFVEEFGTELQTEINDFLSDRAAVVRPNLQARLKELLDGFHVDFEPMLYAAREKGVKIWGIDASKADPGVPKSDPRYHERRLVIMNAEAKRVFDQVRTTYPNEPFLAMTGQQHLNTAEGGVPGLAQIMGVPGVCYNKDAKRLAFIPEDTSKRAAFSTRERDCVEAILKKAGTDYKDLLSAYLSGGEFAALPNPKPELAQSLNGPEVTAAVQAVVKQFVTGNKLTRHADIPRLLNDPAVAAALDPIFQATLKRPDRQVKVADAIKSGDLVTLRSALDDDPYILKMAADETKGDTLLHAACEAGKPGVVDELIQRGMNPNVTDLSGQAPIHRALGERSGAAPLASDLADAVGHLLTAGANATLADPTGKTGLSLAKTGPFADGQIVGKFVTANATPATDLFVVKFVEAAEINYAAVKRDTDVECDTEEARQAAIALVGTLPGTGVPLGTAGEVATALTDNTVTAELDRLTILWGGRNQRKQDVVNAIESKSLANLKIALNADPRLAHIPIDPRNRMALGLAAIKGDSNAIDELLDNRGVHPDQKNPIGRTALHEVLSLEIAKTDPGGQQGVTAKANKLIARGADVNARNGRGQTAMHLAGFRNNIPMITALRAMPANGPDLNARDERGWTPLDMTLAATNREAEDLLHTSAGGAAPPLKAGKLSTVDILTQATLCEDPADSHKVRKFFEQIYANDALRPMLHLAAAAACGNHKPPNGGLRLFANNGNTVGPLYGRNPGATAAYDEKVNTLLFPLEADGTEGAAVGSLAHELTHLTAHLVTNNPATLPFSDGIERGQYVDAIEADVRKIQLLDEGDPLQEYIKNRFSDRMDSYTNHPGTATPRSAGEFDEALLQEFIVGVPQIAAVYGMDELEKHLPGLVGYYKKVWVPKVEHTLALDARFAAGRAKIDTAANGRMTQALQSQKKPKFEAVEPILLKKDDKRLTVDKLMEKIEANFVGTKGKPKDRGAMQRTVNYKPDDFELGDADKRDFEKKKPAIRAALTVALSVGNFPPKIDLNEIRILVENVTGAAVQYSGDNLKTALNNRTANWVKDAKMAHVQRLIQGDSFEKPTPQDLAEVIAYRSEARAAAAGAEADLDSDIDVKASKQRKLIEKLTATLSEPSNSRKLKDPEKLISEMSGALSDPTAKAVYQKPKAGSHVSVDVSKAKSTWLLKLGTM